MRSRPIAPRGVDIAFQSPVAETLHNGVEISTQIAFSGCRSPVLVQVSVIPSAEYCDTERDGMPKSARFAIAVGDASISAVQFTSIWVEVAASAPAPGQLVDTQIVRTRDAVIARGTMTNWARNEAGVSIIFLANWLSHRAGTPIFGGESCYLSLPALTGTAATVFAGFVFGDAEGLNSRGDIVTVGRRGSVVTAVAGSNASLGRNLVYPSDETNDDLSIPKPSFDEALGTVWQCTDNPDVQQAYLNNIKRDESIIAEQSAHNSLAALSHSGDSGDCSGIAVVSDGAFQTVHDLTLALIGVLLTFGASLIFSGALFAGKPSSA